MSTDGNARNVVLVEDHPALRRGVELMLRDANFAIVGSAASAEEAYEMIDRRRPALAIIDISLPGESGTELSRRLLRRDPALGVVLYTGVDDVETLADALESGARGFVMKAGPPEELVTAMTTVLGGGRHIDRRLHALVLATRGDERARVLTPREREILALLAQGMTGEQVAERLVLSPETVRTHVRNAMDKLEARTRVHAVALALRNHEIEPDR